MRLEKPLKLDFENSGVVLRKPAESEYIRRLRALINTFAERLFSEGREFELDGVKVFDADDPFLPGKIVMGLAYWVTEYPKSSTETADRCVKARQIIAMTATDRCDSWGMQYYLKALCKFQEAGLLECCVDSMQRESLKQRLDWRKFVDPDGYWLKKKPNNFYGVAYSIAYSRFCLGWECEHHAQALLEKLLEHYHNRSGEYGFPDETDGEGRYDRYSFLLIAEVSHHFREAGKTLTPQMETPLRKSVEYVLYNINYDGQGFQYGRSIGAYGDSAFLEILSAAAWSGLLNKTEFQDGYAFSRLITKRFLEFWYDESRRSVNLWENGRTSDPYRGKHRILGENLSLIIQHLSAHQLWERARSEHQLSVSEGPSLFSHEILAPSSHMLTWFQKSERECALISLRSGRRVFNLPLVNAGKYYRSMSYSPTPFSKDIVQGSPSEEALQLVPTLELANGLRLAPISLYQDVRVSESSKNTVVTWQVNGLVEFGEQCQPVKRAGCLVKTTVSFYDNRIERIDHFQFDEGVDVERIYLDYFSVFEMNDGEQDELFCSNDQTVWFELSGFDTMREYAEDRVGATDQAFLSRIHAERYFSGTPEVAVVGWKLYF